MSAPDQPFLAPWQAQVFGLTVALSEAGLFNWPDWTQALGAQLATGAEYWDAWLQALEVILTQKGVAVPDEIAALAHRWQDAAHATPHGQPILLENASG
ncbi:nitrile hydratase accessory protein [Pararhodobacter zhoushanensis]|uniref:nitrile hydratase accessory protein n=1 Tax=Pararhodobacter zhoushanensis TaxID=2479545 RepID=UPI001C703E5F|nr:nitrile hydratase accessory protein [Pararhodobacter zhoushanensis]